MHKPNLQPRRSFAAILTHVDSKLRERLLAVYRDDYKVDNTLDREHRGEGNRWKRRAGWILKQFNCTCEWSPCNHEFRHERPNYYVKPEELDHFAG